MADSFQHEPSWLDKSGVLLIVEPGKLMTMVGPVAAVALIFILSIIGAVIAIAVVMWASRHRLSEATLRKQRRLFFALILQATFYFG